MVQDAVMRNLQIMAESSQRISDELKQRYSHVDWKGIAGFRNVLVHDYLRINLLRVWMIIEHEVPKLKDDVTAILKQEYIS